MARADSRRMAGIGWRCGPGRERRSRPRLGLQVFLKPVLNLAPPQALILRLADPVAFVGEDDEAAGDVHALQRGEHRQVFRIRNSVIELAASDERRRLEVPHEEMW